MIQLSHLSIQDYWKKHSFDYMDLCWQIMSLFFNTLSRHHSFSSKEQASLISWLQSLSVVTLEPKKIKSVAASTFPPFICHEVMGPDTMSLGFWMLRFKPDSSLSSSTFIKRLFSSSSFSSFFYIYISIFFVDGPLGCFCILKITNNVTINIRMCFFSN